MEEETEKDKLERIVGELEDAWSKCDSEHRHRLLEAADALDAFLYEVYGEEEAL